ncbi:NADP-dependent phosphogluconate dehydrogenase [Faecalicatena contorta]|uniref:6-phosphogluconate dehydrogenase, decarboxylating n=1 Tax=Faecalicatena contorta TaxID=39482 RepID=A0A315ZNS5_9FIRM|nr:NADP-dependent phosphogluconate dehydrogenase [Faecalicatena contorta]PWJ47265.1 6-phosphogluconate dehydrogenase [Faecalicatena contorta]SUQ16108.1 6-phosphogluconate dehydrogenase [Faecalicatena contorta]
MSKQNIGIIGLAVMGKNLALNIADHGYTVSVFNRSGEKTEELLAECGTKNLKGYFTIEEFVQSLELPRKIILMVKAGNAVDDTIRQLKPHLVQGDIIIDGGNSYFAQTIGRSKELEADGFYYFGVGISGGEEGARTGPAIMPGGDEKVYELIKPILTDISAKVDGELCCHYIGRDGAGHFIKMVHNGIEYADMQLICEAYLILKSVLNMSAPDLHEVFKEWNQGELNSYLIGITSDIFAKKDIDSNNYLVDMILDVAGQKGTGKWTSQVALDLGVSIPTITGAVFERYLSSDKDIRVAASQLYGNGVKPEQKSTDFVESVRKALYASKICAYAQGFSLMLEASRHYGWTLDLSSIAKIFRGGCIIRAQFLNKIAEAYQDEPELANLLMNSYFKDAIEQYGQAWRDVVSTAIITGISVPGFSSAIAYFDSFRTQTLPMNLLQAQRDYFGSHTYQRIDKEGTYHTQW